MIKVVSFHGPGDGGERSVDEKIATFLADPEIRFLGIAMAPGKQPGTTVTRIVYEESEGFALA